jgi:Uma2 family endonuclease
MSAVPQPHLTYQEYLARERVAEYKNEYYQGEIFAMTGGTPEHNTASVNTLAGLHRQLIGSGCRPFNSDQRIRIPASGLATYPDISVFCGRPQRDELDSDAFNNPRLIIEILSTSTESYDRGQKFARYRELDSLLEYVLVSQRELNVERFARRDDGTWVLTVLQGMDAVLRFESIEAELTLAEIYRDVDFAAQQGDDGGKAEADAERIR